MEKPADKSSVHQHLKKLVQDLRQTNAEMTRILERLPLSSHDLVEKLAKLSEKQKRLVNTSPGTAPESIRVLLDNQKHSARYIQMRYHDAMKKGKLRKSS